MAWLRGGYENAEGVIESLKEQAIILQNNLSTLIKQKSDMKESYDEAVEKVGENFLNWIFLTKYFIK